MKALYRTDPWHVLLVDVPFVPIESHDTTFTPMQKAYRELLDKKLAKTYWGTAHHLPITEKNDDPVIPELAWARKVRRSRAGV